MKVVEYTKGMSVTISIEISIKIYFKYPSSNNNERDSDWMNRKTDSQSKSKI